MRLLPRGRVPLGAADGLERGERVSLRLDGIPVSAYAGESVAAVMIAERGAATRRTAGGERRGVFCGMGVCFDCLVVVDGVPNTRACMTLVAEGMVVDSQSGSGAAR